MTKILNDFAESPATSSNRCICGGPIFHARLLIQLSQRAFPIQSVFHRADTQDNVWKYLVVVEFP